MVTLDKIYTRGGDAGETSLVGGARVSKYDLRVQAFGAVDEANAALGLARTQLETGNAADAMLARIQNDLFDMGADLATPAKKDDKVRRCDASYVERLEREIDAMNDNLKPLTSFILPGGSMVSSFLHQARTIVRRAEGLVCGLRAAGGAHVNAQVAIYLNRLSDHLFVLARHLNDDGAQDVLWRPGASREGE